MNKDDILTLLDAFSGSNLSLMEYEAGGVRLKFKKPEDGAAVIKPQPVVKAVENEAPVGSQVVETKDEIVGEVIKSPLVGTFYAAPSPEDEPYVKVGDTVKKGQVIGIIEAMKLMNEIEAEKDGVIRNIFVGNGDVVEYDQSLFEIA